MEGAGGFHSVVGVGVDAGGRCQELGRRRACHSAGTTVLLMEMIMLRKNVFYGP